MCTHMYVRTPRVHTHMHTRARTHMNGGVLEGRNNTLSSFLQDNHVKTSKYNIITFLPLNLIEQFTRVANTYFLILVLVQLIPEVVAAIPSVSSVSVATTIIPLVFVLGVTAIKDAFDDIVRPLAHIICTVRTQCTVVSFSMHV